MIPLKLADSFGAAIRDIHDLENGMAVVATVLDDHLDENSVNEEDQHKGEEVIVLNVGGRIFRTTRKVKRTLFP